MPELPEVEQLRQSLLPILIGAEIATVRLFRVDIVAELDQSGLRQPISRRGARSKLLAGQRVVDLLRHGKELALLGSGGGVLCVHLGMTGQLLHIGHRRRSSLRDHVHCQWRIKPAAGSLHQSNNGTPNPERGGRLIFRDPRRFGGIVTVARQELLHTHHWRMRGPDALQITPEQFTTALERTTRAIKAVLLDQRAIAGVGNIYADEALFGAGINPATRAETISPPAGAKLLMILQTILRDAIALGGSSIRDFIDSTGRAGAFKARHQVYARAGRPCVNCQTPLDKILIAQRTTVFCPLCQTPE